MAGTPAVHSGLLLSLTAELEKVARLCCLPSGWTCHPSLRLTPKGASLLVHWSPSPAAEKKRAKGDKSKRRKRSAASQKRSAERAALHKARQGPTVESRQRPLNPAAAPYAQQIPIPSTPNSVRPAAVFPAAEESERVVDRMEGVRRSRSRSRFEESQAQSPAFRPGPAPQQQRGEKRERLEWQADVAACQKILLDAWGRGVRDEAWRAAYKTLDSLAGAGSAQDFLDFLNARARQIDMDG
jgi:hypothetical protein